MGKTKAKPGMRKSQQATGKQIVAVAWYSAEQWPALLEGSSDREALERTHEEWLVQAEEAIVNLTRAGLIPKKVLVDVDALMAWCKEQKQEVDGGARATYAAKLLRDGVKVQT